MSRTILARLDLVDDDEDMPAGFFLLSDERQRSPSGSARGFAASETVDVNGSRFEFLGVALSGHGGD